MKKLLDAVAYVTHAEGRTGLNMLALAGAILGTAAALSACTQAEADYSFSNYGKPARVTCYSGGVITSDDFSTGKVAKHGESDGFYYTSQTTGRVTEVTGDCDVDYGAPKPEGWKRTHLVPAIKVVAPRGE